MSEPTRIVGMRVADSISVFPGSNIAPCTGCDEPTYLAPAGQKIEAEGGERWCLPCFKFAARFSPGMRVRIPKEVREELKRAWRRR
jgi:hypothetical protein